MVILSIMRTPLVAAGALCGSLFSATALSSTISTLYRALPCNAGLCRLLYRKVSNDYVFGAEARVVLPARYPPAAL
jgi:hypothetical protein